MKILIMGLPGAGKTWLAEKLQLRLNCAWYNADEIRRMANDWDFSEEARYRQTFRMKALADQEKISGRTVICDFVCPKKMSRIIFNADITIWMDTIEEGRFADTNAMFERPDEVDLHIEQFITEQQVENIVSFIKEHGVNV